MPRFVHTSSATQGDQGSGYDSTRDLQVVRNNHTAKIGLECETDDDVFSGDQQTASVTLSPVGSRSSTGLRTVSIKGGKPGSTRLYAVDKIGVIFDTLEVTVVDDVFSRRVGKDIAHTSADIRTEAQAMSLRDAVMLVAEDQMRSSITGGNGFGVYGPADKDWCGFFAWWCWDMAAKLKGVDNPFGSSSWTLASPIRAVSWAMRDDTPGQLLHYEGGDEFGGNRNKQEYREFGFDNCNLERGDIVLLHAKHVCMVYEVNGDTISTMNGNQGNGHSIKIVARNVNDVYNGKKLYFIHVKV